MNFAALLLVATATGSWWHEIDDAPLAALIDEAIERSPDLAVQAALVRQARANATASAAGLYPRISLDLGGQFSPFSNAGFAFGLGGSGLAFGGIPDPTASPLVGAQKEVDPEVLQSYTAYLTGRLNIDIGRTFANASAAGNELKATTMDAKARARGLATNIALTWNAIAATRAQLALIEKQQTTAARILELVEARFETSETTAVDVLQQRQQVEALSSQLPSARAQLRSLELQLLTLLGRESADDTPETPDALSEPAPLKTDVDVKALALERPDLVAARQRAKAAGARTWSGFAAHLPTLSLQGQMGPQTRVLNEAETVFNWTAGVTLSIPLFEGGSSQSSWDLARAGHAAAEANLRAAELRTVQGAENAWQADARQAEQLVAIDAQLEAANKAAAQAEERYAAGLVTYQTVLLSVNGAFAVEVQRLLARKGRLDNRVTLYDALGQAPLDDAPVSPVDGPQRSGDAP